MYIIMHTRRSHMKLKAIVNSAANSKGETITIFEVKGDPLNLEDTGTWDLAINIKVPKLAIQPRTEEEIDNLLCHNRKGLM